MNRHSHDLSTLVGRSRRTAWPTLILALAVAGGCQSKESKTSKADAARQAQPPAGSEARAARPVAPPSPRPSVSETPVVVQQPERDPGLSAEDLQAEVFTPEVLLSEGHRASCRLQVGDIFPDLPLTSLEGEPVSLASRLGERLTIVVFWQSLQPMSSDQIRHLEEEFAERYRAAGIAVVAINVGDAPEDVRNIWAGIQSGVTCLIDPDGQAFAQVATSVLPRTYLLRADRQIVWFDLEYSRSSRRELRNAIRYVLRQFEQQANTGSPSLM